MTTNTNITLWRGYVWVSLLLLIMMKMEFVRAEGSSNQAGQPSGRKFSEGAFTEEEQKTTFLILGGVIGGFVLLVCCMFGCFMYMNRRTLAGAGAGVPAMGMGGHMGFGMGGMGMQPGYVQTAYVQQQNSTTVGALSPDNATGSSISSA